MMTAVSPSFESQSFRLVAQGLVALHKLIKDGNDESAEAEAVRDAMDLPLKALSQPEKERARWLSEDLYSISTPPETHTPKELTNQAQQQINDFYEARQNQEWDRALALLRRCQDYLSPAMVSYLRGSIWLHAGSSDVATEFYKHASESEPTNANYRAIHLHALSKSDPKVALALAEQVLADPEEHAPVVVARAADIRFREARSTADAMSGQMDRQLIPVLERNLARLEADVSSPSRLSAYAMTVGLIGFCNQSLGNSQAAIQTYTRGLRLIPNNDGLLVARGILQYGESPQAISDLEKAVQLDSPAVWPYLFLAHHYLITGRFEECQRMCETGLRRHGSNKAKSRLEEWRAISQAELGFPAHLVRPSFETAIQLDPSNETAQRNYDAFEESLTSRHTIPRSPWQQRTAATVSVFGLAERPYASVA
jgi:tetratricopeptide (TPR) repeat protein